MSVSKKSLTFPEWITHQTTKKLSRILKVNVSTVRHWRSGRCLPRADQMMKIIQISRGKMSYKTMIEGYFKRDRAEKEI